MSTIAQPNRGTLIDRSNSLSRGLLGYWPTFEGTGTAVADYSGNNRSGTITGAHSSTRWIAGVYGTAFASDADTINVPAFGHGIGSGDFSVSVWGMRTASFATYQGIFAFGIYAPALYTRIGSQDQLGLYWGEPIYSGATVELDVWEHYGFVRRGDSGHFFQNGRRVGATANLTGKTIAEAPVVIGAGRVDNGEVFYGRWGNTMLHNRALSDSEMLHAYTEPWALIPRKVIIPAGPPPTYDIQGSNVHGDSSISFGWTVNPA